MIAQKIIEYANLKKKPMERFLDKTKPIQKTLNEATELEILNHIVDADYYINEDDLDPNSYFNQIHREIMDLIETHEATSNLIHYLEGYMYAMDTIIAYIGQSDEEERK